MKQLMRMLVLTVAISLLTSCGLFKNSRKDEGFCSKAAFVNVEELKPIAPATLKDTEFHQVAGTNVKNQHKVITAYSSLRECWDYWVEDKKQ